MSSARTTRLIPLAAVLAVGLTYFGAWSMGLWWDDYVALRPWSVGDLRAAFVGTWDPWLVWPLFYRPVTVAVYGLSFFLFGLNPVPMHLMSLVGLAAAAWLTGLFTSRETGVPTVGVMAAVLYGVHPTLALSQGPWLFQQHHLLCTLTVLLALLTWQRRRQVPTVAQWWPLYAYALFGFLIVEDMIMLAPLLLGLQMIRAYVVGDVPRPGRVLILTTMVFTVALVAWRWVALGEFGGLPLPTIQELVVNWIRGPIRTLFVLQREGWLINQAASVALSFTVLAGVWSAIRQPRSAMSGLLLMGVIMVAGFSTPLVFASSTSRFHLVGLGGMCVLAASIGALAREVRTARAWMVVALAGVLVGTLSAATRAAGIVPLRPCGEEMLWSDRMVVQDWPEVPPQIRAWLVEKPGLCAGGAVPSLKSSVDVVSWAIDESTRRVDVTADDGGSGTRVVFLVTRAATQLTVDVRASSGSGPVAVRVNTNGELSVIHSIDAEWRSITVDLTSSWWTITRDMHRVDLAVDQSGAARLTMRRPRAVR